MLVSPIWKALPVCQVAQAVFEVDTKMWLKKKAFETFSQDTHENVSCKPLNSSAAFLGAAPIPYVQVAILNLPHP